MKNISVFIIIVFAFLFAKNEMIAKEMKSSMAFDGKMWTFHYRKPTRENVLNAVSYRYFIEGDTIVGWRSIPAKKLYAEDCPMFGGHGVYFVGGIYEEDHKVYIAPFHDEPWLLYDFSANPGDRVDTWMGTAWVQSVDTVVVGTDSLRRLGLSRTPDGSVEVFWVEGVGSCFELLWNINSWPRFHEFAFASCEAGGEDVLYSSSVFPLTDYQTDDSDTIRVPYQPMLKEGKKWCYQVQTRHRADSDSKLVDYTCAFILQGDTIVNGEKAVKMYLSKDDSDYTYHSAWIETDWKVYKISREDTKKTLMFDFGLRRNAEWYSSGLFYLHRADVSAINGTQHNQYVFCDAEDQEAFVWIEGIGQVGPYSCGILTDDIKENFESLLPANEQSLDMTVRFVGCYEDNEKVYPQEPQPDEILLPQTSGKSQSLLIYDLSGRCVGQGNKGLRACPSEHLRSTRTETQGNRLPKGVYIQNGKKFVIK